MAEKKKLSEQDLVEYIALNLARNIQKSIVLDREADLESAKAEDKRLTAKAVRFEATVASKYHPKPDQIIDDETGEFIDAPTPKK